ncbi:protein enabled homolog [Eupeodes corollae]|uniref:protein enabled homolog n=1 Tax=Eupeodes corollae TaxID=290404 RepID=UPI0024902A4C|nr:protein enabled homolog [Eupeodes corollae]
MRSFIVLVVLSFVLVASADKKEDNSHKTTVRVKPGILSILLGSKPTSISVEGSTKKQQKVPALLSYYPILADYPSEQKPEKKPSKQKDEQQESTSNPNSDPYTFLPQRPIYPQAYPVPVGLPYPQIPPYGGYGPGYPPMYPVGIPPYGQYPMYPPPMYPYPSKYPYSGYTGYMGYPGYPGYPLHAEPSNEQSGSSSAPASQNPKLENGQTVTSPQTEVEPDDINEIDPYVRVTKTTPAPLASMPSVSSSVPVPSTSVPMLSDKPESSAAPESSAVIESSSVSESSAVTESSALPESSPMPESLAVPMSSAMPMPSNMLLASSEPIPMPMTMSPSMLMSQPEPNSSSKPVSSDLPVTSSKPMTSR